MKIFRKKSISLMLVLTILMAIVVPVLMPTKVNADNTQILILETGTDVNSLIGLEDYMFELFFVKDMLKFDEQTGRITNKQSQKLLFTLSDGIITLADDVSASDNLEYVLTDEEKAEETPLQGVDKVILSFSVFYNVTFETNGGSAIPQQKVFKDLTVEQPENPTKDDYTFIGWYSNIGLTTPFNFSTPITQDTTIYAKWEKSVSITIENGTDVNALNNVEDAVLELFFAKDMLKFDEQTGRITNKQSQKLLFTLSDGIITLADDVSASDDLEYAFTDEEKAQLIKDTPLEGIDKVFLKFKNQPQNQPSKEYTLTSANGLAKAIFTFNDGFNFELNIKDILTLTPAQIQSNYGMDEATFNSYLEIIKNNVKQYGTLIAVYDITIDDGGLGYSDELKLKINLTDAMKEFDTLKFIYLDENNNFVVGDVKDVLLTAETGDVDLDHLSVYALVGNKTETQTPTQTPEEKATENTTTTEEKATTSTNNPKTGDNVAIWISLMIVSMLGIAGTVKFVKKNK